MGTVPAAPGRGDSSQHGELRVTVGVSYSSDMDQVERLLTEAGAGFAKRDPTFEPRVLLTEFGSSSVDWELSVWIQDPWARRSAGSASPSER